MYTIKQAASRSGVPVQLLRAWERRYGVVEPTRTPSGYRLYDEAAIARLRAMRRLIDEGWAPSTAAGHIRQIDERAVVEILSRAGSRPDLAGGSDGFRLGSKALTDAFVEAAAALDECEKRGVTTVIDTGSGRPWTGRLLGRVDHVIAPEKYVLKETGYPAERAAVELWGDSCRVVFGVTKGKRGGVFTTGKEPECLERWDATPVTAVDSCGAGDTFHGAYAWALAMGLSPAECFDTAAWSAGLKVSQLGNKGIPTLDQLENARQLSRVGKRV